MYCLRVFITGTTLFTTMLTVIIVVCSLNIMCSSAKFHFDWLL